MTTADETGHDSADGWSGRRWLNPPSVEPYGGDPACVLLSPAELALLGELLAAEKQRIEAVIEQDEAASTSQWLTDDEVAHRDRRSLVSGLAAELEWAPVRPEDADARISREATYHPANQLTRLMPIVLIQLSRWTGGKCVVSNAVQYAAAIEASRNGWDGAEEVGRTAINAGRDATRRAYGTVEPPTLRELGWDQS